MNLIDWLTIHKTFLVDSIHFWWDQVRYNASSRTNQDQEKMEYILLREVHTIEKGLSLREPRLGFGQQKVKDLLVHLTEYWRLFGGKAQSRAFLQYPLSVISYWIDYTQQNNVEINDLVEQYTKLSKKCELEDCHLPAGVTLQTRADMQQAASGNFSSLLYSRHSVRYFQESLVGHELIDQALEMAQQTPSACNRQGWKTHVYEGETCHQLLHWQGGSRGFEQDIHQAILVTANQKAFLYYEMHQAYVDGGLYAMNLINALHSLGLGTIPLSCGFKQRKLRKLRQLFHIPPEEVPIVIIGFGQLPDNFKVAVSERKPIAQTNRYH